MTQGFGPIAVIVVAVLALLTLVSCVKGDRWTKEWEERYESFQPSDKIMDIMDVGPGMVVGEIGAGNGRFAVKVSERVGPFGRVFANDIDAEATRFMERRCRSEQISNMTVIHSQQNEPGFPDGELDLVYIINTYDELSDPVTLLRNAKASLKPEGRLAVIVYDPSKFRDHQGHAVAGHVVISQCTEAGFRLVHTDTTLIYDNIYIFRCDES